MLKQNLGSQEPAWQPGQVGRPPEAETVDAAAILARLGGNRELLAECVQFFLEDCPGWLVDLHASLSRGDANQLRRTAHLVRGVTAHFSPTAAHDIAARLEGMGETGDLVQAASACRALEEALARLGAALLGLVQESSCSPLPSDREALE